jgi:hypothetical protein
MRIFNNVRKVLGQAEEQLQLAEETPVGPGPINQSLLNAINLANDAMGELQGIINKAMALLPKYKDGVYRYPDGSAIWLANQVEEKWCAHWADRTPLRGDNGTLSYFDSPLAAAEALMAGGEGPADPAFKNQHEVPMITIEPGITHKQLLLLATYGFKWYHDGVTDRVDADCIQSVSTSDDDELVVRYKALPDVVMESSTATVDYIEIPEDPAKTWIFVHYKRIQHKYRKEL